MGSSKATALDAAVPLPERRTRRRWQAPLHVFIGTSFTLLVVVAGGAIGWHNYVQNRDLTMTAADALFGRMASETRAELEAIQDPAVLLLDLLAQQRLGYAATLDERMASVPFLAAALAREHALSAVYAGYPNGDFFLLRRYSAGSPEAARFAAPVGTAYVVQSVERDSNGRPHGTYAFFDAGAKLIDRRAVADYTFDPRTRGWYTQAQSASGPIRTPPYAFFTTREVGITIARRSGQGPAIVGVDATLRDLSSALAAQPLSPSSELVLFTGDGTVLADRRPGRLALDSAGDGALRVARLAELGSPPLAVLAARFRPGVENARDSIDAAGGVWETAMLRLHDVGGPGDVYLALATPRDELLSEAWRITRSSALLTLAIVLACVPIAWLASHLVSGSLQRLTAEARAIRRFDFAKPIATRSAIREIGQLGRTMDAMKRTIRQFLDIAATIAGERKFDRLLGRVLAEVLPATASRAAAIYLADDNGVLKQAAARATHDRAVVDVGVDAAEVPDGHPVRRAIGDHATIVEALPDDARARQRAFGPVGTALDPRAHAAVVIPLRNRQSENVGALALFHDVSREAPSVDQVAFAEALSGTIAVAIENQSLLLAQKALLEAFIRVVARAIDAKSPYTGRHCQRVPELTRMLAQAACDARDGAFRDFTMTEDDWEALHIAAWLHDCGKVTTPEQVVDKATKLEAIYDRLHEIRMRFEVLKRDAEIDCWRRVAAGGNRDLLLAGLAERQRDLDEEFAFVAACNRGGEAIAPASVERLRRIGQRTWQRTLDDRIGLSNEERRRKERLPAPSLPATEPLLADKPEHLVDHDASDRTPRDERWGFHDDATPYKANLGEIYNLSVARGTLTAEDRHRINDHVVRTITMLSELPFTGHLKRVPEIAGGHHERVDGKGYPRGLHREDMSVEARMVAIADVFEALTAADRPYKSAKPLSEAIRIMAKMRDEHHLDPDLFELFLRARVYVNYAMQHLDPALIDEVDIAAYLKVTA
jgi:HD-GYP domain-containing protein (c-di-GMP phosphodiesterase class II)